ncbi:hypothetical protein FPOAC1_005236 [Fusarium poae]|uniref:hypothetical protein n=1 Tax=Fusarium poae TaxID=36050 RepID=UPI001CE820D0|nr:hypothetical protein FPOAC1_005236 [Fusarium poae]KAG8671977.1 hypothetical protein FPOAC1_005236 [Fusarium poae]
MSRYAKDQPSGLKNTTERVAIVGAAGTIGAYITAALLQTGNHTITALTRENSTNILPNGVIAAYIDYNDESSIVSALKDQQFLIITMAPTAPRDTHRKLVQAAAKAGVPLAGGEQRFGFDLDNRSVTFYDDGTTKNSTSTLSQVGRAVAKILSLKELPVNEEDNSLTFSSFLNKPVNIKSFTISQKDMFESVKRVTGTSDADWIITYESTKKRYEEGMSLVKSGNMVGFSKLLYARAFFPEDPSDLSAKSQNDLLGLPEESLGDATKAGIDLVKVLKGLTERMAS